MTQVARVSFRQELDQLRLQVEVMAARVDLALDRMHQALLTGDADIAEAAIAADDEVDAMHVSLTERTYDLIRRESPVATDLRYLVSVLRVLEELERIADLSLRVVKQTRSLPALAGHENILEMLDAMAALDRQLFRSALDAWSSEDPNLVAGQAERSAAMDHRYRALLDEVLGLQGEGAVAAAVSAALMGQALERIADHTVIVGDRLQYLLTGDPAHIASEVR